MNGTMSEYDAQTCRDCGATFAYDPDADRCPACVAALLGEPEATEAREVTVGGYVVRDYGGETWILRLAVTGENLAVYGSREQAVAAAERYERMTAALGAGA